MSAPTPGYNPYQDFFTNPLGFLGKTWNDLTGAADNQQKADQKNQQIDTQLDVLKDPNSNPYRNAPNPYAPGNPGLTALLGLQQGAVNRHFADAETDARRSLAARGMLGSDVERHAMSQMALDRARQLSSTEADLTGSNYQNYANYGLNLLNGLSNYDQFRQQQLMSGLENQRGYYQQQHDAPYQAAAQLVGVGAQALGSYYGNKAGVGSYQILQKPAQQPTQQPVQPTAQPTAPAPATMHTQAAPEKYGPPLPSNPGLNSLRTKTQLTNPYQWKGVN